MTFPDFNPVALQLGPLAIRWYALAYIAGILLGWAYARRLILQRALATAYAEGHTADAPISTLASGR